MLALQILGGIEEHGGDPDRVRRVPIPAFARFWGVDVSTACRRLQKFTDPDGRWDDQRRRRMSEEQKARAVAAGKTLSGKAMRSVRRVHKFLNKNAGYGQAQLYELDMPDELKPRVEEGQKMESPTANIEMLAKAFGTDWFDPTMEGINNYKWAPGYVTHLPHVNECICKSGQLCLLPGKTCPKCDGSGAVPERYESGPFKGEFVPLADYAKNLFYYLWLKGLGQFGSVQIGLDDIGRDTGMDENTVAKYRDELELLQVVRIISGNILRLCIPCNQEFLCTKPKDKWLGECPRCKSRYGKIIKRWDDQWIYVAEHVMDEETALREYERFQSLRDKLKIQRSEFDRAEAIHILVLKEWRGREHSILAFFNYMRRRLAHEGLNRSVIDALFPFYRE